MRLGFAIRRGLTLIEIMVVIAVLALLVAVGVPTLSGVLDLQQQAAAEELGRTYNLLREEAGLRNVTFRVAYNLDANTWGVEVGDPTAQTFSSPDAREKAEEDLRDEMKRFTKREIEEGAADELEEKSGRFQMLADPRFNKPKELPSGIRFAWVYTPAYAPDGKKPSDEPPEDPADQSIAYTYVFPDGSSEHIVVRIVDEDDPESGYTLEVEPLSGKAVVSDEVVDPTQSLSWLPTEGPKIQ